MLVLTRKIGQRVLIGETIVVTIIDCGNGRVRLGIEAPEEVGVFREEVLGQRSEGAAFLRITSRRPTKKG